MNHTLHRPRHGLSIIELMVGLVVGLLVSLAAVNSAQLFGALQRQGIGTGSGNANTASVLASIKNDVANGGLGFFGNLNYLCTTVNISVGATVMSDGAAFAPVQVTRVGNNDRIDIAYGTEVAAGAAVKTSGTSDGTSVALKTYLPVTANQAVLLAAPTVGTPCLLRTVTTTPANPTATTKETLTFANTGTHNQAAFTTNPTYPDSSLVTLIGTPQWNRYELNGTDLQLTRMLDGSTVTLLRNVMALRVQYGVAAVGAPVQTDGSRAPLSAWQKSTDAGWTSVDNTNIGRIKAVQIGIMVRIAQKEKINKESGQCEATTAASLSLLGEPVTPDVTDWKCYRYRTQIVVAPLRNVIYGL